MMMGQKYCLFGGPKHASTQKRTKLRAVPVLSNILLGLPGSQLVLTPEKGMTKASLRLPGKDQPHASDRHNGRFRKRLGPQVREQAAVEISQGKKAETKRETKAFNRLDG